MAFIIKAAAFIVCLYLIFLLINMGFKVVFKKPKLSECLDKRIVKGGKVDQCSKGCCDCKIEPIDEKKLP
ncbi:MAG: hypothetical protein A4E53_02533 [Pelotomaculum sp. PtaB.Bin104]|nr:MAG: hypothetical protein A4E53_02533 [Pelotomaculum sp. PtaB.Bin104]